MLRPKGPGSCRRFFSGEEGAHSCYAQGTEGRAPGTGGRGQTMCFECPLQPITSDLLCPPSHDSGHRRMDMVWDQLTSPPSTHQSSPGTSNVLWPVSHSPSNATPLRMNSMSPRLEPLCPAASMPPGSIQAPIKSWTFLIDHIMPQVPKGHTRFGWVSVKSFE